MAPKPQPKPSPGKYGHGGKGEKYDPKKYGGKTCRHSVPLGACALCAKGK